MTARGSQKVSARREELPGKIIEAIDDVAIFALDLHGHVTSWNFGAEQMSGVPADEVLGQHIRRFHTEDSAGPGPETMLAGAHAMGHWHGEGWRVGRGGRRIWVRVTLNAMTDADGTVIGFGGFTRDLTEQHLALEALRESEGRLRSISEAVTDAIISIDASQRIVSFNRAAAELYGRPAEEVIGQSVLILVPEHLRESALEMMHRAVTTPGAGPSGRRFESLALHRDGHQVPIEMSVGEWTLGGEHHLVGVVRDITERTEAQADLRRLAEQDALTGLLNRRRFETELARVVEAVRRGRENATLLVLDLDGFKEINDRFGHSAGDELLVKVGALLSASVRQSDAVGRLGGDEFGIVLRDTGIDRAREIAAKLTTGVRAGGTVAGRGQQAPVTVSTGITEMRSGEEHSGENLLIEADSAMYAAKAQGRNCFHVHERGGAQPRESFERRSWLGRLRRALDEDLFELYGQPIVSLADGQVVRHELLLRLGDEPEPLLPGAFLADAERFGLIGEIDRWVLARAIKVLEDAQRAGIKVALAVNLSGKTMNDASLASYLWHLLREHTIAEGSLLVEVTETAAIVNFARAADLASELRSMGCEFALDDFGSGFSSLLYLKHLDFDYLKIDGEFIAHLIDTPTDQLVVRAVVQIAEGLGTRTIAECVPDAATMALLAELGVDYAQGFHLGEPRPLGQVLGGG